MYNVGKDNLPYCLNFSTNNFNLQKGYVICMLHWSCNCTLIFWRYLDCELDTIILPPISGERHPSALLLGDDVRVRALRRVCGLRRPRQLVHNLQPAANQPGQPENIQGTAWSHRVSGQSLICIMTPRGQFDAFPQGGVFSMTNHEGLNSAELTSIQYNLTCPKVINK